MTHPLETTPPAASTPSTARPSRGILRRLFRFYCLCCGWSLLLALAFTATPVMQWAYDAMECQDELRHADYIICLGGSHVRVLEAVRLLEEGHADKLIVTNFGVYASQMRDLAVDLGAPPEKILVDDQSGRTLDHPISVQKTCGVDPAGDVCIVVTDYTHLPRARACFKRAGYQHLIMRDIRWDRMHRRPLSWKGRLKFLSRFTYECLAWLEYWRLGVI